jgi:hypothetical protein
MTNSVIGLSIDWAGAATLAQFWADVLGRQVKPEPTAEFAAIEANESRQGPWLAFHQAAEAKTIKHRPAPGPDQQRIRRRNRPAALTGVTRVNDVERAGARWTTFRDPEGNEFDLLAG